MKSSSELDASIESRTPAPRTLRGLDWLNFFLADVQTGVGPFLAIYLAGSIVHHFGSNSGFLFLAAVAAAAFAVLYFFMPETRAMTPTPSR
jgi:hypothetical protein